MKIENLAAFPYFMGNEVYLLPSEREALQNNATEIPEVPMMVVSFNYLGNNKKNFLVLTNYTDADFISPNHSVALESTLKRLGFEMDDLAILNIAKYPNIVFDELIKFFEPNKILILGKSAQPETKIPVLLNKIAIHGNTKILTTFSFEEMMDNAGNKKIFWELMKQL